MAKSSKTKPAKAETQSATNRKVVGVKRFCVEVTHYSDGTNEMDRFNDGYNPLELLGVLAFVKEEVFKQVAGIKLPITIKRKVIVND